MIANGFCILNLSATAIIILKMSLIQPKLAALPKFLVSSGSKGGGRGPGPPSPVKISQ